MNDVYPEMTGTGCSGPAMLIIVFVALVGFLGLGGLSLVDGISENRATAAQQAALQEQARAQAEIETARAQAAIAAERTRENRDSESYRTERQQNWLYSMQLAVSNNNGWLICVGGEVLLGLLLVLVAAVVFAGRR